MSAVDAEQLALQQQVEEYIPYGAGNRPALSAGNAVATRLQSHPDDTRQLVQDICQALFTPDLPASLPEDNLPHPSEPSAAAAVAPGRAKHKRTAKPDPAAPHHGVSGDLGAPAAVRWQLPQTDESDCSSITAGTAGSAGKRSLAAYHASFAFPRRPSTAETDGSDSECQSSSRGSPDSGPMADKVKVQIQGLLQSTDSMLSNRSSETSSLIRTTSPLLTSRRTSNTNQYSLATERLQLDFETHAAAMETPNMRGALSGGRSNNGTTGGRRLRPTASFREPLTDTHTLSPDPSSGGFGAGSKALSEEASAYSSPSESMSQRRSSSERHAGSSGYDRHSSGGFDNINTAAARFGSNHSNGTTMTNAVLDRSASFEISRENSTYQSFAPLEDLVNAVNESVQNGERRLTNNGTSSTRSAVSAPGYSIGGARSSVGGAGPLSATTSNGSAAVTRGTTGGAGGSSASAAVSRGTNGGAGGSSASTAVLSRDASPKKGKLAAMLAADFVNSPQLARMKSNLAAIVKGGVAAPPEGGKFAETASKLGGRMQQFDEAEAALTKKYKATVQPTVEGIIRQASPPRPLPTTAGRRVSIDQRSGITTGSSPSPSPERTSSVPLDNATAATAATAAAGARSSMGGGRGSMGAAGQPSTSQNPGANQAIKLDDPNLMKAFAKLAQGQAMLRGWAGAGPMPTLTPPPSAPDKSPELRRTGSGDNSPQIGISPIVSRTSSFNSADAAPVMTVKGLIAAAAAGPGGAAAAMNAMVNGARPVVPAARRGSNTTAAAAATAAPAAGVLAGQQGQQQEQGGAAAQRQQLEKQQQQQQGQQQRPEAGQGRRSSTSSPAASAAAPTTQRGQNRVQQQQEQEQQQQQQQEAEAREEQDGAYLAKRAISVYQITGRDLTAHSPHAHQQQYDHQQQYMHYSPMSPQAQQYSPWDGSSSPTASGSYSGTAFRQQGHSSNSYGPSSSPNTDHYQRLSIAHTARCSQASMPHSPLAGDSQQHTASVAAAGQYGYTGQPSQGAARFEHCSSTGHLNGGATCSSAAHGSACPVHSSSQQAPPRSPAAEVLAFLHDNPGILQHAPMLPPQPGHGPPPHPPAAHPRPASATAATAESMHHQQSSPTATANSHMAYCACHAASAGPASGAITTAPSNVSAYGIWASCLLPATTTGSNTPQRPPPLPTHAHAAPTGATTSPAATHAPAWRSPVPAASMQRTGSVPSFGACEHCHAVPGHTRTWTPEPQRPDDHWPHQQQQQQQQQQGTQAWRSSMNGMSDDAAHSPMSAGWQAQHEPWQQQQQRWQQQQWEQQTLDEQRRMQQQTQSTPRPSYSSQQQQQWPQQNLSSTPRHTSQLPAKSLPTANPGRHQDWQGAGQNSFLSHSGKHFVPITAGQLPQPQEHASPAAASTSTFRAVTKGLQLKGPDTVVNQSIVLPAGQLGVYGQQLEFVSGEPVVICISPVRDQRGHTPPQKWYQQQPQATAPWT